MVKCDEQPMTAPTQDIKKQLRIKIVCYVYITINRIPKY